MTDILVTGIGIISALGDNAESNRMGLMQGKTKVTRLENVKTVYAETQYFGEIKHSNSWLCENLKVNGAGVTRTSLLSYKAFLESVADAHLSAAELASSKTALISASTVGGMCLTDEMYHDANQKEEGSEYIRAYDAAASTFFIQQKMGMQGPINTINTACSSSANAIMFGAQLIKKGVVDRAIVGGVDSLAKFTINGFKALHILSENPGRPFDRNRDGLNLGEGAAYLVLEKAESVTGKKVYAKLSGYGNANDSYHASALSDSGIGPARAMRSALQVSGLKAGQISYVNAHGTGTENNDVAESNAMKSVFGTVPEFSSTKSFTGHTLGAAGAVEAVFSILAIHNQEVYPNLHFADQIPETGLTPILEYHKKEVRHVMSNSFGFGGNCSALIFSAV